MHNLHQGLENAGITPTQKVGGAKAVDKGDKQDGHNQQAPYKITVRPSEHGDKKAANGLTNFDRH